MGRARVLGSPTRGFAARSGCGGVHVPRERVADAPGVDTHAAAPSGSRRPAGANVSRGTRFHRERSGDSKVKKRGPLGAPV